MSVPRLTSKDSSTSIGDGSRRRLSSRSTEKESEALDKITTKADEDREKRRMKINEAKKIRQQKIAEEQNYSDEDDESGSGRGTPIKERSSKPSLKSNTHSSMGGSIPSHDGTEESKSIQERLFDLEQKYKEAMVSNAQLHNEKTTLFHQVDSLKDKLEDNEQTLVELQADIQRKKSEFIHQKHEQEVLSLEINTLKAQIQYRDNFIEENGLSLPDYNDEDESQPETPGKKPKKQESGSLDRHSLLARIDELTAELEHMKNHQVNPVLDGQNPTDIVRESTKLVNEYKQKLQFAEADNTKLEGTVSRLEGNVKRLKAQVENLEQQEDELIKERRKQAREVRKLQQDCDELRTDNELLQRRIETIRKRRDKPDI